MATGNASDRGAGRASGTRESGMAPPRLLSRPAEARPLPLPIHDSDALVAVRRRWAQIAATTGRMAPADERTEATTGHAARVPGGVRAKVKARVATAAAGVQAQDRAMTAELVGALDALSRRVDELTSRVHDLESLVQEVVEVTSEELTRVEVAFGAARDRPDDGRDRGRGNGGPGDG